MRHNSSGSVAATEKVPHVLWRLVVVLGSLNKHTIDSWQLLRSPNPCHHKPACVGDWG